MSREVVVPPERIARWFAGFVERNGAVASIRPTELGTTVTTVRDGHAVVLGRSVPATDIDELCDALLPAASAAVLLIRRGGYALATARCTGAGHEVTASKTGRRYVQGRTAAGGQSQQRYARRRSNQADALAGDAAESARRVLGDRPDAVDLLVTGGDPGLLDQVLSRIPFAALSWNERRHVEVGEPRRVDVDRALQVARSIRIDVTNAGPADQKETT